MRSMAKKKITMKDPVEDKVLKIVIAVILTLFVLVVSYPVIFVVSSSFSSGLAVSTSRVVLWPVDFNLKGYEMVFSHKYVIPSYINTIFYTVVGTAINLVVTLFCAYPLSRKDFPMKNIFMGFFLFTMFFSGGLIPTYMLMSKIKFINTVWVMLIPGAMSVYNMILVRTYFSSSIPKELLEASQIDGCSDAKYFFSIMLPLSKPIIAVITLYYAVGHWNAYFSAMMYLNDKDLYPLQLILRQILLASKVAMSDVSADADVSMTDQGMTELLKYALIVVSTAPIMCVYPFIQRYFIKGVMIGSVKG